MHKNLAVLAAVYSFQNPVDRYVKRDEVEYERDKPDLEIVPCAWSGEDLHLRRHVEEQGYPIIDPVDYGIR